MTNKRYHRATNSALAVGVLISLVGCAATTYDGVLWRQVADFKDPLGNALNSAEGTSRSTFVEGVKTDAGTLPGHYWDGIARPADLGLGQGGAAYSNIQESENGLEVDGLISSGARNSDDDDLHDSQPDYGPSMIYTCFTIALEAPSETITGWTYLQDECDADLVRTLGGEARFYPVEEFHG